MADSMIVLSQSPVGQFIWKTFVLLIQESISFVPLQNHNAVSISQIVSFIICLNWVVWFGMVYDVEQLFQQYFCYILAIL